MTQNNRKIAQMFEEIADALEILGDNPYRVQAYRRAARVLRDLDRDVEEILRTEGPVGLERIPGIGERMTAKIIEYLREGKMSRYEEVMAKVPRGLLELMKIPGLGPRTIYMAWKQLGVTTLEELIQAIEEGKLQRLPGMGPRKVENILKGIEIYRRMSGRIPLGYAYPLIQQIVEVLAQHPEVEQISPAGSFRRMKETVGDLDLLATGKEGGKIVQAFVSLPQVTRVLAAGDTKGSAIFEDKYQVDLRVVPSDAYGAALQYFTGSKEHNIHLRAIARERAMKISEYGVFRGDKRIAGKTEEEVYAALDMDWIPPELREDRGEIEAAMQHRLPDLVAYEAIRGDLHVHSRYSDGHSSLKEIMEEAARLGYAYVAVTDHSVSLKVAHGLDAEQVAKKLREIQQLNQQSENVRLLAGAEVEILPDGSLDYPDEILAQLDYVIVAVHQWRRDEEVTQRVLRAMENPYVHAIAHPTGRLLTGRPVYRIDLDAVAQRAAALGVALEINGHAERLDLNDVHILRVKKYGVKFVLGTDAHHHSQMWMMRLAVGQARRGWCAPEHIINTRSYHELTKFLTQRRKRLVETRS